MIDASLIFDGTLNPVAGAAITATRDSTNIIDLLVARDVGSNQPLTVHVQVLQAFATLTSLQIQLMESADASTWYQFELSPVYPVAQLILAAPIFRYDLPIMNQELNSAAGVLKAPGRYLKLNYIVAGSNATAGSVFSYITPREDRSQYYSYPIGYSVAITAGEI